MTKFTAGESCCFFVERSVHLAVTLNRCFRPGEQGALLIRFDEEGAEPYRITVGIFQKTAGV
ncbi:MAG: hypothetical protein ACK5Q6_11310 [Cyanobacteriota bacterium]